jgi:hypothetical protein
MSQIKDHKQEKGIPKKAILLLGLPGHGKTYKAKSSLDRLVQEHGRAYDAAVRTIYTGPMVLVFSPDDETFSAIQSGLGAIPFKWFEEVGDGHPFLRFGDLGSMLDFAEREGKTGTECIVMIDELLLAEGYDFTRIKRLAVARRHLNIMLIACSQRPVSFPVVSFSFLDELESGRIEDQRDLQHLVGTLTPEQLKQLPTLERGEFVHKGETILP